MFLVFSKSTDLLKKSPELNVMVDMSVISCKEVPIVGHTLQLNVHLFNDFRKVDFKGI